MKVKLDENMPRIVKEVLYQAGAEDVHTVFDENLEGSKDKILYKRIENENRILITLDSDFLQPIYFPKSDQYGLLVIQLERRSKWKIKSILEKFLIKYKLTDILGKTFYITESSIHITGFFT
jgi:predicted nuclease of predicted toxin-antitoxin system